jgi:hypothetical protein
VTLAVIKLAERGAVVQRDGGWLLLEGPAQRHDELLGAEPPPLMV